MSDYELINGSISSQKSVMSEYIIDDENNFPELNTNDDYIDPKIISFKNIIFCIYSDVYRSIFKSEPINLEETLINLNNYLRISGLSYQKFPLNINFIDILIYLNDRYYKNVIFLIETKPKNWIEKIDDIMIAIEIDLYKQLQLTSPNSTLTEDEYWNIDFSFIEDLSLLYGIKIFPNNYLIVDNIL